VPKRGVSGTTVVLDAASRRRRGRSDRKQRARSERVLAEADELLADTRAWKAENLSA
jgi:hypothetical protein